MQQVVYNKITHDHSNLLASLLWDLADAILDLFPKSKKCGWATVTEKITRKEFIPRVESDVDLFSITLSAVLEEPLTTSVDFLKLQFKTKDGRDREIVVEVEFEVNSGMFKTFKIGDEIPVRYLIHHRNGLISIGLA